MEQPSLCVIFNPTSGRRRGARRLEEIRRLWPRDVELRPTEYAGHAAVLAEQAARSGFAAVAAAGGDGTVHEVANGLLRAARPDVTLVVAPIGSANDYAWSLRQEFDGAVGVRRAVDVGRVRDDRGRERYFVCNLGAGLSGQVTLEARRIRWLQGLPLYGLAALRAIRQYRACPRWSVQFDDEPPAAHPTVMLSVLLGRREGNFRMAPEARLGDGWFDYVHTRELSRSALLRHVPRLALSGPPTSHPQVRRGRCRRVRLQSDAPLCVHTDGELFCTPADAVMSLEIELLPSRLHVELLPPA